MVTILVLEVLLCNIWFIEIERECYPRLAERCSK